MIYKVDESYRMDIKRSLSHSFSVTGLALLSQKVVEYIDVSKNIGGAFALPSLTVGAFWGAHSSQKSFFALTPCFMYLGALGHLMDCPDITTLISAATLGVLAGKVVQKIQVPSKFAFLNGLFAASICSCALPYSLNEECKVLIPSLMGGLVAGTIK
ncbi:MAG: hypothetical protein COT85_01910 [Chlamydiae bacterium CG10_big_fil_rev_8_21_14_0_10_42_34]|nr:MAG: hypothetical protein COT85_01910 [Chlamydiae bacterium CG10_big_fil_rev_8_21_14_0_10_42_34]